MTTYMIIRYLTTENGERPQVGVVVRRGMTREQATEWCRREDTMGRDERGDVVWYDGFAEEIEHPQWTGDRRAE